MRFFAALVALASVALGLEDGVLYITTIFPNATLVTHDATTGAWVETLTEGPLVEAYRQAFADKAQARTQRRTLSKRAVGCKGNHLDHSGVDTAVNLWKGWLGAHGAYTVCSYPTAYRAVWYTSEGMAVYYCILQNNYCGSLDLVDFNYALVQMDAVCVRYTESWFRWDGSPEIVGKVNQNTPICY